jgi:threonine/homoserine/homoserine lactone efflux protein
MLNVLLQGIGLGLTLSFLPGPVFFALLQTSISKGFKNGLLLAAGIFLSDATLVFVSYLGVYQFIYAGENKLLFGIVGGSVLIGFGIYTYIRRIRFRELRPRDIPFSTKGAVTGVIKGYFLNITNPFVWIFWISWMGVVTSNYGTEDPHYVMVFFGATLATVLTFDVLKSYGANKIKPFTKPRTMKIINRVIGIIMIAFGIVLMGRVVWEKFF